MIRYSRPGVPPVVIARAKHEYLTLLAERDRVLRRCRRHKGSYLPASLVTPWLDVTIRTWRAQARYDKLISKGAA